MLSKQNKKPENRSKSDRSLNLLNPNYLIKRLASYLRSLLNAERTLLISLLLSLPLNIKFIISQNDLPAMQQFGSNLFLKKYLPLIKIYNSTTSAPFTKALKLSKKRFKRTSKQWIKRLKLKFRLKNSDKPNRHQFTLPPFYSTHLSYYRNKRLLQPPFSTDLNKLFKPNYLKKTVQLKW